MKLNELKHEFGFDTISKKAGVITGRRQFYYRSGGSSQKYVDRILAKYPNAKIVDHGEHYAPFRGGSSTANSSHWYVKFSLEEN